MYVVDCASMDNGKVVIAAQILSVEAAIAIAACAIFGMKPEETVDRWAHMQPCGHATWRDVYGGMP